MARKLNENERLERFFSKVEKSDSCWIWIGSLDGAGYGCFWNGERLIGAHRMSHEIHKGPTDGLFVMHSCDNRCCVNPAHLSLGTNADNMKDMVKKGRHAHGSKHASAKLSESDIPTIRVRISVGERLKDIAADYRVAVQQISAIKSGKNWRHVEAA